MKLTFEIEIPPVYIPQLRKLLHHSVDNAFENADMNAESFTITTQTIFGTSTFVTTMDKDCMESMQKYNKYHTKDK